MRTSITKMALAAMLGMMPMTNLCAQEEVQGFVHEQSSEDGYEWPTDKQVLNKLDQWQDQKFGVLMGTLQHTGHCGVVEYLLGRRRLDFAQEASSALRRL